MIGDIRIGRYESEPVFTKQAGAMKFRVFQRVTPTKKICIAMFDNESDADFFISQKQLERG